jgi:hypothetical protein
MPKLHRFSRRLYFLTVIVLLFSIAGQAYDRSPAVTHAEALPLLSANSVLIDDRNGGDVVYGTCLLCLSPIMC